MNSSRKVCLLQIVVSLLLLLSGGCREKGEKYVPVSMSTVMESEDLLPVIELQTNRFLKEIEGKEDNHDGNFRLNGFENFDDVVLPVKIRGRGNSSRMFVKRGYRLKFQDKISLCGLPASKDYVLLPNYTDCSLMLNSLAFKIGQMLGLPYTPQAVPVEVGLNGLYKGSYILTNKVGINSGSVDIDPENSVMWELDVAFDEDRKFMSPVYQLPVMVADPKMSDSEFDYWKKDFIEMEKALEENRGSGYFDIEDAAKYLLVYEILKNDEGGMPKSVKFYKTKGGKYHFGPIWDFDVALGKVWRGDCFTLENIPGQITRNAILGQLEDDPIFQETFKKHLNEMYDSLPSLLEYIDTYAARIRPSALRDHSIYPEYEDYDSSVRKLKESLKMRFGFLMECYGR